MVLFLCLISCLLLALVPLQLQAQTTTATHNVTVGSVLNSAGPNISWLSPSGEFAFGFRAADGNSSEFLLAIWFVNTADRTTAWYVNGDKPAPIGSTLQFTSFGLSLKNSAGQETWSAGVNGAVYAAMLDTGNFVLYNSSGKPIWQSFDNPSDTILPTQVLQLGSYLKSRLMATDYTTGRFILRVQDDGNLVFYTLPLVSENQYSPYWASDTVGNGTKLVFNETGNIYFVLKNGTFDVTFGQLNTPSDFYQRATLDYDGVFRQYVHPKRSSTSARGGWSDSWTVVDLLPENICDNGGSNEGSGICGFNSYCKLTSNNSVDCECPPQYSFLDPNRKYKGCTPDFPPQSCKLDESDQFEFLSISNLDWRLADYEWYYSVDEDTCRQQCLNDCFCSVVVFSQGNCWKKKIPLSNGRMGDFVDRTLLLKVPKNNSTQIQVHEENGWKKDKRVWILAGSLLLGSSVFVNVLLILVVVLVTHYYQKKNMKGISQQQTCLSALGQSPLSFTYKELESATNEFSEEVGRGGSGVVYKGYIHQHEQETMFIAVKNMDTQVLSNTEKEYTTEVQTIGQTFHRNLVRLLGFCNEGPHRLLVFEFMNNGSLNSWLLNGTTKPSWNQRFQVALGIARGLLYLHEECSTQIVHCDMKPQNILLDDNLTPKISDFGLAKLLKTDQTRTNTGIRGTKGYVAPEWFKNVGITSKVDVYSFGVILLEIVCCRRNVDQDIEDEEQVVLAYWVNDCYRDGRLSLVLPTWDEEAARDMRRIERFVKVALWCIQEEPSLRPTMLKVTQMLDGAVDIPIPPDPSSYISSIQ
ncbi:Serine/threonine-protein kinase [Rhynchospora pubera]|uniref:Receptor-like serine/threonine-protein kinase n=1 Tax=Rhynchospora pubera TaxID=906938 RepID=A0AAV8CDE5_9POAL|nr:Serine/threonine-protein kinase [Rhynchospora pubera]